DRCVPAQTVAGGVVHELPADLRAALIADTDALDAWNDITPLARNESSAGSRTQGGMRRGSAASGVPAKSSRKGCALLAGLRAPVAEGLASVGPRCDAREPS